MLFSARTQSCLRASGQRQRRRKNDFKFTSKHYFHLSCRVPGLPGEYHGPAEAESASHGEPQVRGELEFESVTEFWSSNAQPATPSAHARSRHRFHCIDLLLLNSRAAYFCPFLLELELPLPRGSAEAGVAETWVLDDGERTPPGGSAEAGAVATWVLDDGECASPSTAISVLDVCERGAPPGGSAGRCNMPS